MGKIYSAIRLKVAGEITSRIQKLGQPGIELRRSSTPEPRVASAASAPWVPALGSLELRRSSTSAMPLWNSFGVRFASDCVYPGCARCAHDPGLWGGTPSEFNARLSEFLHSGSYFTGNLNRSPISIFSFPGKAWGRGRSPYWAPISIHYGSLSASRRANSAEIIADD